MFWAFLTNNNNKREAMDIGITTKKPPQLDSSIDTFVNLINSIDQPQGVHKIKTTLFSISLPELRELWWTIHFQGNFYLTCNRNLGFLLFTWICCLELSKRRLIASCDRCHGWGRRCLLNPEHLVMLLAGPISHTSTQYIDFVDFLYFTGFVYHLFCSF